MVLRFLLFLLVASVFCNSGSLGEDQIPKNEDVSQEDGFKAKCCNPGLPGDENQSPKLSQDDDFQGN